MKFISAIIVFVVANVDYCLTKYLRHIIFHSANFHMLNTTFTHDMPVNDIKKMIWSTVKKLETSSKSKYAYVNYMNSEDMETHSLIHSTMVGCQDNFRSGLTIGWPIRENEKDLSEQLLAMQIEENFDYSWMWYKILPNKPGLFMYTVCGYLFNGKKVIDNCFVVNGYSIVNVKSATLQNGTEITLNYIDHNLQETFSATHHLYNNKVASVRTKHFYIKSVPLLEKLMKEQKAFSLDENAPLNQYIAYKVSNMELKIVKTWKQETKSTEIFLFCEHDDPWIKLYLQPSNMDWYENIPERKGYAGFRKNINIDECSGTSPVFFHFLYCHDHAFTLSYGKGTINAFLRQSKDMEMECKNGECEDTVGSYKCNCHVGWTGQFCDQTVDLCEQQKPCGSFKCTSVPGSYKCECGPGLTNYDCSVDIEECTQFKPCKNDAECIETFGSYKCICRPGWTGQNCDTDIDECSKEPKVCQNNALCENSQGSFRCNCKPQYSGKLCEFDAHLCRETKCLNGECIVSNYKPQCQCYPGWTDAICSTQIDECNEDHDLCKNGATCSEHPELNYTCACLTGFTGRHCEQNINDCTKENCVNGWCVDLVNDVHCICNSSWTGKVCNEKVDSCHDFICEHGSCHVTEGITKCNCTDGHEGLHCDIKIDECLKYPCSGNSTCIDGDNYGTFECLCPPFYTGLTCASRIPSCSSSPCKHEGTCFLDNNSNYGYACKCPRGTVGFNCEDLSEEVASDTLTGSAHENLISVVLLLLMIVASNLHCYSVF